VQLIGMLDSPYVRRVAISLQLLGVRFEHRSLSVFRTFAQFQQINPVVKAPSLVCDDGEVLMDSTLILEYAEALAAPRKSLMPADVRELQHTLHMIGLSLACGSCDWRSKRAAPPSARSRPSADRRRPADVPTTQWEEETSRLDAMSAAHAKASR